MTYVYVGNLEQRHPKLYSAGPGWYHVVNDAYGTNGSAPVHVASDDAVLLKGGGDPLWPGESICLWDESGIWIAGPKQGPLPKISVEIREKQTFVHKDPFGVLQAAACAKVEDFYPIKEQWLNVSSGTIATYAVHVRAKEKAIYVGTHMGLKYNNGTWRPPEDLVETAGKAWRLEEGESKFFPGNPLLWVWTYEIDAKVELMKFERGWTFGNYEDA